jgi:hypothetical protein
MNLFLLARISLKFIRGNIKRAQRNEFSITESAEPCRVVENVSGLASSVFRVFRKPMLLEPEKSQVVVMTCLLTQRLKKKT